MNSPLTDAQFELLEQHLTQAGLHRQALFNDLLDHYYCLTTWHMDQGQAFDEAAHTAYKELAPGGFSAIEQELQIFLHLNIHLRMNRILYLGAFLAAFGETMYVLFRNQNWPGASAMLLLACAALFFMVIPAWLMQFRRNHPQMPMAKQIRFLSGLLAITLFGMGSFFKVQHWNGANIMIVLGMGIFALVFFPLFFREQYKEAVRQSAHIQQLA